MQNPIVEFFPDVLDPSTPCLSYPPKRGPNVEPATAPLLCAQGAVCACRSPHWSPLVVLCGGVAVITRRAKTKWTFRVGRVVASFGARVVIEKFPWDPDDKSRLRCFAKAELGVVTAELVAPPIKISRTIPTLLL